MAIELEKVSPPKTYGELFRNLDEVNDLFSEVRSTLNVVDNNFECVEFRGGIGNKVLFSMSDVYHNQEVNKMFGHASEITADKLEGNKSTYFEELESRMESYVKYGLEDSRENIEPQSSSMWTNLKTFISNNIILLIMNHIDNETLYEKLVNSLFDSLALENGDLD